MPGAITAAIVGAVMCLSAGFISGVAVGKAHVRQEIARSVGEAETYQYHEGFKKAMALCRETEVAPLALRNEELRQDAVNWARLAGAAQSCTWPACTLPWKLDPGRYCFDVERE